MKEFDYVRVTVEKERYAKEGVHKGMEGTILDPRCINNSWLVFFEDPITFADTIGIPIKEKDLELVIEFVPKDLHVELIKDNEELIALGLRKGMKGVIKRPFNEDFGWRVHFKNDNGDDEIVVNHLTAEYLKEIK